METRGNVFSQREKGDAYHSRNCSSEANTTSLCFTSGDYDVDPKISVSS